uniref:uncharacterized protein LOC117252429 isoform X2 n=1 Tax=Epinephelus lanceolatus TaxID=310571 RepID=UPI0014481761|nr:uncharacterized protein LOC117252429 isoform X2 [Epinephelus lanceolatus]
MVAAVTKSYPDRLRTFWFICPMFHWKNIRELTCLFVTVCILMRQSLADDRDFMEDFLKREYSLAKPYRGLGFSSSSQWDLMGTAMVTPDHVRLTPDLQSRQGAVWSRVPFFVRDWELKVHFKIHGQGKKNLNGDGMAIWLTKDRMQNGPVFGNMNQFIGLGIFVDTYPNADKSHDRVFPYVSVMLGNGTLSYNHDYDGRHTELGGCTAMTRNAIYDTFLLIRYSKNRLMVMVDVDGKQEWKDCVDILGVRLPTGYFFGASSATGDLSVEVEAEGMSGVQFFFTLLFSILGLGVLAVLCGAFVVAFGEFQMIHSKFASLVTTFWPIYPANTLVVTGTIVTCVCYLGVLGGMKENRCMLISFFILLFILMLVELAMACVFLVYSREIDTYFENDLMRSLEIYRQSSPESNKTIKEDFDAVQHLFRCCGVHGVADWKGNVPISCCSKDPCNNLPHTDWQEGCLLKLRNWFARNYLSTGAGVVTMFIIQFICLSITIPLFCHLSRHGLGYQ